MKPLVLVFPGQGSQYVGMGENFKNHPYYKQTEDYFDFSLTEISHHGPNETLKLTEYTQPAIILHSMVLFDELQKVLTKFEKRIDFTLGHSVGEYAALCAAGSLSLEQALKAVHLRGQSMQKASPVGVGAMFAILKLDASIIENTCLEVSRKSGLSVSIANHNTPEQIVISGHKDACNEVIDELKRQEHKFRSIELPVSAPFHCDLMAPAKEPMTNFFKSQEIKTNTMSYIANIDAAIYPPNTDPKLITQNLIQQITGQVRWVESINKLPENSLIIEVGPGKVLTGLCQKIRSDIQVLALDAPEAFEQLSLFLNQ